MTNKKSKKLQITRETLRQLGREKLADVAAAAVSDLCQSKCTVVASTCLPNSQTCYHVTANC